MEKEHVFAISGGLTFSDDNQMLEFYKKTDIHATYNNKYWMDWLVWSLEDKKNIVKLKMPGFDNANYNVWKIIFEKYLREIDSEKITIVAHSLGTIFILKYLVENNLKIKNLHLVGSFVSDDFQSNSFDEGSGTFTFDYSKVSEIESRCENIFLWHSTDDTSCTIKNSEYLHEQLPKSKFSRFEDRGHFNGSTFVELFDVLK